MGEGTIGINQQEAPDSLHYEGVWWQRFGPFTIQSGSILVRTSDLVYDGGYVIADAVMIKPYQPDVYIIDDGDDGFDSSGGFEEYLGDGFGGDVLYAPVGEGEEYVRWTFTNLEQGTYRVYITWTEYENRATDAVFSVLGDAPADYFQVDQTQAPDDLYDLGTFWEGLGEFEVTDGTLEVLLVDFATEGFYVIADAVRIERVA